MKAPLISEQISHAATSSIHYGAAPEDLANFPGMVNLVAGSGAVLTPGAGTLTLSISGGGVGTVTSVDASGGSTGLTFSGGPVTTAGTLTMAGTLAVGSGGTGATTAAGARANLGAGTGNGSVTSVAVTGNNGIGVTGSPITTSGTFTLSLGAITPTSVSTGALTASGAISLPSGSITRANLANGTACSVIGRSANSSGAVADIAASTNDRILSRTSNVLSWTQLTAGMVPNSLITNAMLANGSSLSVLGCSGAPGPRSDIQSTGARTFLASSASNTAVTFRAMEAADLPGGNWMNATNGQTTCTTTALTSTINAWEAITGTITLPSAGTYLIIADVSAQAYVTTLSVIASIHARLYNVTDSTPITSAQSSILSAAATGVYLAGGNSISSIVTVASSKTIRIDGLRRTDTGSVYFNSQIESTSFVSTTIKYFRLY